MLVVSTNRLRVHLDDGDILLEPGRPTEVPSKCARELLRRGKVRLRVVPEAGWDTLWTYIAELTRGVEPTDPRLDGILTAIEECDGAFARGSKVKFLKAVRRVAKAMVETVSR